MIQYSEHNSQDSYQILLGNKDQQVLNVSCALGEGRSVTVGIDTACLLALLARCGLLQEGDRVLAINGWSLKARTMRDVTEMIAMSRRHLTLRIEFDVAGCCYFSSLFQPNSASV